MHPLTSTTGSLDLTLLDLLVDGELADEDRRALLGRLDQTPGGWRACALAFLESQAWKDALRRSGAATTAAPGRGRPSETARPTQLNLPASGLESSSGNKRGLRQFAGVMHKVLVTGIVALAFSAGWFCRPLAIGDGDAGRRHEAVSSNKARQPVNDVPNAELDGTLEALEELGPALRPAGMLHLFVPHEDGVEELTLPVVGGIPTDADLTVGARPALAPHVIKAFERQGHRVTVERDLITLGLSNGDGLVVPIDRVDVQFAGRVFQ